MSNTIDIEKLAPGMITAEAVQSGGRTIIGADTELTEKMISVFKAWGVVSVSIKGDFNTDEDEDFIKLPPEVLDQLKTKVTARLRPAIESSPKQFDEVKRVMLKCYARNYLENSQSTQTN